MSCWPLPQQLFPVPATGGGHRCCINSGIITLIFTALENLRIFQSCFLREKSMRETEFSGFGPIREKAFGAARRPQQAQNENKFSTEINFPHEGFPRSGEAVTAGD